MAATRPAANLIPSRARQAIAGLPADSLRLDWPLAIISCAIVFGLFIDGWAHNHGQVDDSFFTPWHALLYGAIGLAGLALILTHFLNVNRGYRWSKALPAGYSLSLIGFFAFATGGLGDLLWHEIFGFEESLEALLSPSHLFLAISGLLIVTGPIRAMWSRQTEHDWRNLLPVILCFTCIISIFTFFTTFAAITGELAFLTGGRPEFHTMYDIAGIIAFPVHTNILLAAILFMARRWRLPFGTVTLIFVVNSLLMVWYRVDANAEFIYAINAGVIGLLADILLSRGIFARVSRLRFFAFIIPFAYSLGAMLVIHILGTTVWGSGSLWWEIHMWLGVPVLAGACGYGLSLLLQPPTAPQDLAAA